MELRLAHIKDAAKASGISEADFDNWAHSFALCAYLLGEDSGYKKGFSDGEYEAWKDNYYA